MAKILLFDRSTFFINYCNERFAGMLHYTPLELTKMTLPALLANPLERSRFVEQIQTHEETPGFNTALATKEGAACRVNLSWSKIDDHTLCCFAITDNETEPDELEQNSHRAFCGQLTANSPVGVLIIQDGNIQFSNPAFTRFSGFLPAELHNKNLHSLIDDNDTEQFRAFAKRWNELPGLPDTGVFRFRTKSGELKVAELFTMLVLHHGSPATLINLLDITEKVHLEERIQLETKQRHGVVTTLAHELRTPLQPILGYLNLLMQDPEGFGLTPETQKILARCLTSVDRERQIINKMLDLSQLESGKLVLKYSTFPPLTLVNSVIEASGYAAKAQITLDIPGDISITADIDRLFVVIDSILSNAINYSQPPRKIIISYHSSPPDSCHHLSFQDNGIGIPENALLSIFEPFQLADAASLSRKYDRIGLSLSITKKIMELHGGDITVRSIVNSGSTFTLHIPKEIPHVP
ncbi:MAG: PAS domain-containing sensor histidine kinase [Methanoregula sp.]|nr:PAS domain-containing sensor histidine kinase [Methanoregula sp.]